MPKARAVATWTPCFEKQGAHQLLSTLSHDTDIELLSQIPPPPDDNRAPKPHLDQACLKPHPREGNKSRSVKESWDDWYSVSLVVERIFGIFGLRAGAVADW
jgi:hypothetical protein